ncbi:MAG: UDP-glucose 4-epimerase [Magnetococcales bacterium]|nr:UDP-glucose 4-epimerase [Magnetococcales bacterium]HIJ84724.1 NAD(P)-dependent oxidoreductase [Magnetococcales bacterium]
MNILLTGSSGFTGGRLVRQLIIDGHRVWGLDCEPPLAWMQNLEGYHHSMVDLGNIVQLRQALSQLPPITMGIHTAAKQPLHPTMELSGFIADNVLGTANLLTVAKEKQILRWVVLSSFSVYGPPQQSHPITEEHPTLPDNAYGLSKLHAEGLCHFCARHEGFHVCVLRCKSIFGVGQNLPGFVQYLVQTLECNEDVRLFNRGKLKHDPVYVDDVVTAVRLAMNHTGDSPWAVFNIGGGAPVSSLELAETIKSKLGSSGQFVLSDHGKPPLAYDAVMDLGKAKSILGYAPRSLSACLDDMLKPKRSSRP